MPVRSRGRFWALSLLVGMACLVVSLVLWQALLGREDQQQRLKTETEAVNARALIYDELEARIRALARLARIWELRPTAIPESEFSIIAGQLETDFGGFAAIEWADAGGQVRWVVPRIGNEAAIHLDLSQFEPRRRSALKAARDRRKVSVTQAVDLVQGGTGFLVYAPMFHGARFSGALVGVFRFRTLLGTVLENVTATGYRVAILDGGRTVFASAGRSRPASPPLSEFATDVPLNVRDVRWMVRVWPTQTHVAETRTNLPNAALAVGLVLGALLVITIGLLEATRTHTATLAAANAALESEIQERHHAEDQLRYQTGILRQVLDSMADGVVVMDPATEYPVFNPAAQRLLGLGAPGPLPPEQWPAHFGLYRDNGTTLLKADEMALVRAHRGETVRGVEVYVRNRVRVDGIWLRVSASPLRAADGDGRGAVAVFHDITERRRVMEALEIAKNAAETANRAKSQFLANMSHEIRTPMNGILGLTDVVLESTSDPEQRRCLGMIRASAEGLLGLLNDILDFAKIEAGRLELAQAPFVLQDLLHNAISTLETTARDKGLELAAQTDPKAPSMVVGDAGRLRQVLLNLLGNGIKYTPEGRVTVQVELATDDEQYLHFSVTDTGIGIPESMQGAIFEPFTQVDASFARKYGGTGLGLAISTELVRLMAGKMWVESREGEGSTFHFTALLPAYLPDAQRPPSPERPPSPSGPRRSLRLLVVEDNPVNQALMTAILSRGGHRPVMADSGLEALRVLERERFDAILMDLQMPGCNGFETTSEIREREGSVGPHTPIIAVTAHAMPGDREKCMAAGMQGYLAKPLRAAELLALIDEVIQP